MEQKELIEKIKMELSRNYFKSKKMKALSKVINDDETFLSILEAFDNNDKDCLLLKTNRNIYIVETQLFSCNVLAISNNAIESINYKKSFFKKHLEIVTNKKNLIFTGIIDNQQLNNFLNN